MKAWKHLASST